MNASIFLTNFDMFPICQMGIKYKASPSTWYAKKKTDIPRASTDFSANRMNAIADTNDFVKEITKIPFFQLNEERIRYAGGV